MVSGIVTNGTLAATNYSITGGGTIAANLTNGVAGASALTMSGAGTLTLSGTNTYTGVTTISSGTLQLGNGGTTGSLAQTGPILDNASLVLNRSNAGSLTNTISGTGMLTQVGSGTFTLSGTNTYTGGTTISAGGIQLGNGGTNGSIVGAILDNASLVLNRTDAYSLTNTISGTGALTQAGSGTVYLTANNTLTGGTIVNAGTLAITNGGTLGASNDAITLNAGTLDLGGQTSTKGNFTMASGTLQNGTLAATNYSLTGSGTVAANLADGFAGASALTKSGVGTAILSGNNTYTGGTTVNAGTLAITNGGTMGAANTAVTLNAGTIDLGGQTSTQGNFTMASGTLQNGTLAATNYSLTGSGTVAANLADGFAGASALTKSGVGTATLSGNNTYSGVTAINAGTLNVVGLLGSSNTVNVNSGGLLSGNGSMGNVNVASGGTLYPSAVAGTNAATTLTAHSLALNLGSTIDMNITPTANVNDKIASSLIQISGGTLNLKFNGTFNTGTTTSWTLWTTGASLITDFGAVNAQGALAGSFTQQTQGSWILTGIPGYADITLNTANGLLTAQAIPEPSTWALLGLSLIMGLVVRRKFLRNKERSL